MPTAATIAIPITIDPEAAAFLAEVGQDRELERMIAQVKATIPHLRNIHIALHDFPETGPPGLTIEAHRDPYPGPSDRAGMGFDRWQVENFPPQVLQNFSLMTVHHTHEG